MTQFSNIEISIEKEKLEKIKKIIKELHDSDSISSEHLDDFIDFTFFIVIDEYDKDFHSLEKFYKNNMNKYLVSRNTN